MPVNHPLGFGAVQSSGTRVSSPLATTFGFGSTAAGPSTPSASSQYHYQQWASPHQQQPSTHQHTNPNPFAHAFARTQSDAPVQTHRHHDTPTHEQATASGNGKRRRSPSDDSMDRGSSSPTSARAETMTSATAGRSMKRLRQGREQEEHEPQRSTVDEERSEGRDADLGVLLGMSRFPPIPPMPSSLTVLACAASLPSSTHLQILYSLIASHPALKPTIHALIPAPEVSFAIEVLDEKVQRLVDAVPVGARPPGGEVKRSGAAFGFGARATTTTRTESAVSDGYILNRLRIPFTEFTNVALTYLPYFITTQPVTSTDKSPTTETHPSISFQYLSHLSSLIITRIFPILPPSVLHGSGITLPGLATLLHTLDSAWAAWLAQISQHVNVRGGMYAASMAQGWITGVEGLAAAAERVAVGSVGKVDTQGTGTSEHSVGTREPTTMTEGPAHVLARQLRQLAHEWVAQVGWLIGRSVGGDQGMSDRMDE